MNKILKYLLISFTVFFCWQFWIPISYSEFYKYTDDRGRVFYVDDLGKVPEAYLDQIKVYREKYDNLSEQERSQALQREREQMQRQEQENLLRMNEHLQEVEAAEEAEKRKGAASSKKKIMETMQTRVIMDGNRILVPVTLVNNGLELDVNLVLDTGASKTVLHRHVADQLNIIALQKGLAQVAGGQHIYVESGQISSFKVGPFNMKNASVLMMAYEGPAVNYSGLLGMNFLRNVQYTIDYQNELIRWQPPDGASLKN